MMANVEISKKYSNLQLAGFIITSYLICFLLIAPIYLTTDLNNKIRTISFINNKNLEFRLNSILDNNSYIDSKSLIGKKYILSFFKFDCTKCKANNIYLKYLTNIDIDVYGISSDEGFNINKSDLEESANTYIDILLDNKGMLSDRLLFIGAPETLLINEQGIIENHIKGIITEDIYNSQILPFFKIKYDNFQ